MSSADNPSARRNPPAKTPIENSIDLWMADVAVSFINASFIGALWGCFNPIPVPHSRQALEIAKTGKFVALPPFSSLSSVGYYAGFFGSAVAIQRFTSGGIAVARGKRDSWNEIAGVASVVGYVMTITKYEKGIIWNNRAVAGIVMGSVLYANTGW